MNKFRFALLSIGLGFFVAFMFTANKEKMSTNSSHISVNENHVESEVDVGINDKLKSITVVNFIKKEGINKLKNELSEQSESNKGIKKKIISSIINVNSCISDGSCLNKKSKVFYDFKKDPIFVELKNLLESIEFMALNDPSILNLINDEHLYQVLKFENKSSSFLALSLLANKGREAILGARAVASKMQTKMSGEFLKNISNEIYLIDEEVRNMRGDLIQTYLSSQDYFKIENTLDTINLLSFNQTEVKEIKKNYCQFEQIENDASKMLDLKFAKFIRKYNVDSEC